MEKLQQYLRDYIITHNLKPGDGLPASHELARDLNVSVSSVREALRAFEMLGVLEIRHGVGIFVRALNFDVVSKILSYSLDFDPSTIGELLQIRKWLEFAAIPEIVEGVDERTIHELEAILADWEQDIPTGEWGAHDQHFHNVLNTTHNNKILVIFLDMFWVAYNSASQEVLKTVPDPFETLAHHRAILDAVKSRDVEACQRTVLDSYRDIEERLDAATAHSKDNSVF